MSFINAPCRLTVLNLSSKGSICIKSANQEQLTLSYIDMILTIPDLSTLVLWLNNKKLESYQCSECDALHLPHLKRSESVFDAKLELIDDIIYFSISTEIKPSSITALIGELSQMNCSSEFVKCYFDIADDAAPKIIFRHILDCTEGVTEPQFVSFITHVEEEALQIIGELSHYDLLGNQDQLADDLDDKAQSLQTYH